MGDHFIVSRIRTGGMARLRDRQGKTIEVPASWLPSGLSDGAALVINVDADSRRSSIVIHEVEGLSEPEGTDIGA